MGEPLHTVAYGERAAVRPLGGRAQQGMLELDHNLPLALHRLDLGQHLGLSSLVVGHDDDLRRLDLGIYVGMQGLGMGRQSCLRPLGHCDHVRMPGMGFRSRPLVQHRMRLSAAARSKRVLRV